MVVCAEIDTRVIEMYRSHSRQQVDQVGAWLGDCGRPSVFGDYADGVAELKAAVQASLAQKVASLEEDRWMFEPEEEGEAQM